MGLPVGDDLLGNGDMWIGRKETARTVQETLRNSHRRDEHPIGPSLRHHRIRLHTVQDFLPLERGLLHLIWCGCTPQRLIGCLEFLLQLLIFLLQLGQLHTGIFIFSERRDRTRDLLRIHLRQKVCLDDHNIAVETRGDLLIEDKHQAGRIGANLVLGHIHAIDDRHALQIRGNLFECVPLGRLRCETDRILTSIAVAHAMLALGIDDASFCRCSRHKHQLSDKQDNEQSKKISWTERRAQRKRRLKGRIGHRLPFPLEQADTVN